MVSIKKGKASCCSRTHKHLFGHHWPCKPVKLPYSAESGKATQETLTTIFLVVEWQAH